MPRQPSSSSLNAGQLAKSTAELWDKLEEGVRIETGKRLFYQLTDEETNNQLSVAGFNSRKCFAVIDGEYPVGKRGGSLVVSLSIFRPLELGGFFQKANVQFTSDREPGTCSSIRPEDTAG